MSHGKLLELTTDRSFRERVGKVLGWMEGKRLDPKVFEAKRTVAEQAEKVRKGYSRTVNSYHVRRGTDGGARAADIASKNLAWGASRRFWWILGSAAWAAGVGWGGLWGLSRPQKVLVCATIIRLRELGWPESHQLYSVRLGWDVAHIQDDGGAGWPG